MEKRINETIFPFSWDGWDGDQECLQLYNVEWFEDWGPFHAGDKHSIITVEHHYGILKVWDEAGKVLMEVRYKCVPWDTMVRQLS